MKQPWMRAFAVGSCLRVLLPWYAHGFRHMDEHWQVMEPANHLVHGAWSIAWEWQTGNRSWIYPWLISLPIRIAELLGIHNPIWITSFVRSVQGLMAALAIPLAYVFVEKLVPERQRIFALAAAWCVAIWPFSIFIGFHTHAEMLGALFVLAGLTAPIFFQSEKTGYLFAGASLGAALALKIDVALAGLGFGIWQLLHKKFKRAIWLAIGALPFVFILGLVDKLTWGGWFQSLFNHAYSNLVEGVGNQWGVSPWYQHLFYYFDITSAVSLLATFMLPLFWRRLPEALKAAWFTNAFFVAVYCFIPHKEKRFLAPLTYSGLAIGIATLGFARNRFSLKTRPARVIGLLLALALSLHMVLNTATYLVQRPWWDRIRAIHEAGQIAGIQKMISPQWPAVYYLSREIPSEATKSDLASIDESTRGLKRIGVATDWTDLTIFNKLGFSCETAGTVAAGNNTTPRAYLCSRQ